MISEVIDVIFVCAIAVVGFFGLWAIFLKIIKWISERKQKDEATHKEADSMETKSES